MASHSHIELTPASFQHAFTKDLNPSSIATANRLLNANHTQLDITWNSEGFHNHIAHHILALLSLGATPFQLQTAYDNNLDYQREIAPVNAEILNKLRLQDKFLSELGDKSKYHEYLVFFEDEIQRKGHQNVLQEYLFKGDAIANDLFGRLFAGLLHPLIHLGYGISFNQPAIIAEALAQAAVHENWLGEFLLKIEKTAQIQPPIHPAKSLLEIFTEVRGSEVLKSSVKYTDDPRMLAGLNTRAGEKAIALLSQICIPTKDLATKTAEMTALSAAIVAGATRPDKEVKFDFYLIHALNASVFFTSFLEQDWLSVENKARLLEWKVRHNFMLYLGQGSPVLDVERVSAYKIERGWEELREVLLGYEDDGHAVKVLRALWNGMEACREQGLKGEGGFLLEEDDWLGAANMFLDSISGGDGDVSFRPWVRGAGFEEAWIRFSAPKGR